MYVNLLFLHLFLQECTQQKHLLGLILTKQRWKNPTQEAPRRWAAGNGGFKDLNIEWPLHFCPCCLSMYSRRADRPPPHPPHSPPSFQTAWVQPFLCCLAVTNQACWTSSIYCKSIVPWRILTGEWRKVGQRSHRCIPSSSRNVIHREREREPFVRHTQFLSPSVSFKDFVYLRDAHAFLTSVDLFPICAHLL